MDKLLGIIFDIGLPNAYDHFAEGESPEPPFLCYLIPDNDDFSADGINYVKINEVHLELYTDYKDPELEEKVEAVLLDHEVFYQKSEVWISDERLYEVLYIFEMEAS